MAESLLRVACLSLAVASLGARGFLYVGKAIAPLYGVDIVQSVRDETLCYFFAFHSPDEV